jgi:rfaE bifunctional protein kinase chain/domain
VEAANLSANVQALDCAVFPVGVIGDDEAGNQIKDIFKNRGISTEGITSFSPFQTIVKLLALQQQLLRIDYESSTLDISSMHEILLDKIKQLMPEMHGIIASDYAKGVSRSDLIRETISEAKKCSIPIICDPGKGQDLGFYSGATTIKPNRVEAGQIANMTLKSKKSILDAASILQKKCQTEFLTISLDKDGILLFKNDNDYMFIYTEVQKVYDVTGAGDMVVSIIRNSFSGGCLS